jgi:hypothetical protein
MQAATGLLPVRGEDAIFQPKPWTVHSVQAHRESGTLVSKAMIFSKTQTTFFRATKPKQPILGPPNVLRKNTFYEHARNVKHQSHTNKVV